MGLVTDGAQVTMAVVTNTPQKPRSHTPLHSLLLTAGAHSTATTHSGPISTCPLLHTGACVSYPLGSRGQSQHTGTLSQVHTHIDTDPCRLQHETRFYHRQVLHHGGSGITHTLDSHIYRPSLQTSPTHCVSPGTMCWPGRHTPPPPPTSV